MLDHHKKLEKNSILLLVFTLVAISVGGLVEIVPLFRLETTIEKVSGMRPLTPLELAGQQIYIRENCSSCHSQQIRPLRDEVERYGHYSLAAESMFDHPFLWGSKRTGPDLARVGGKYSDEWHTAHLMSPRDVVPESIMPTYRFMMNQAVDLRSIQALLATYRIVGVPYTDAMIENAYNDAMAQAHPEGDSAGLIARYGSKVNVRDFDGQPKHVSEMDALVAYLQSLGTLADIKDYQLQAGARP
ncbi:MAG: cytochrome-c oxidase, cbb3-type subunit II [Alphaproteobacteria bacterium]|nr:cytochrome-c oxidase, cbb3-type subunit II [Alphaproteobacteria bacterium]